MKVDLLPHNQEAYEKIKSEIEEGKKKIAIAHATGTGKSYLIAKLFEDYSEKRKLVLVPSTYISDQIKELFEKYGIQNTDVMLYQKLIKMSDEDIAAMNYDVIALDEYHHDTSKVWGEKVRILIDTHSESIVFGTSATPIRSDGVNTIDELFEGNCASDLPLSESIAKKIVPLPKYVGALYALDDELEKLQKKVDQATNTKEEKQELYKKIDTMRSQIEKSYGMPIILNKNIKDREGKYLIFCKNKKHLAAIKDTVIGWFKTAGFKDIHAYVVHSDYENKDDEYKAFCDDTSHNAKLLFSIDMLNEGLHLENISGVLLLRPTSSNIIWHQQIGRCIESNNSKNPVIIDAVNNFNSVQQGMGLLNEIKEAVAKEKAEGNKKGGDVDFTDIDTFFVTEYIQDVQEMFKKVEGKLKDSWDLWIECLRQYKEREGDCLVPRNHVEVLEDGTKLNLGTWITHTRQAKKGRANYKLTQERIKQLNELEFIWEIRTECMFDKFYKHALQYEKKYGHLNIVKNDIIDGYNIGMIYNVLLNNYKKGKLSNKQIAKLRNIGINICVGKHEQKFQRKMNLARRAVNEGVIISNKNQIYCNVNLYSWYKTNIDKFTSEESEIMYRLVPNNRTRKVLVFDIKNNKIYKYESIADASRALYYDFHLVNTEKSGMPTISQRLSGKIKNPIYKNRFRFEYAD